MVRRDDFLLKVAYVIYFGPNPKKIQSHILSELIGYDDSYVNSIQNLVKRRFCRSFKLENV